MKAVAPHKGGSKKCQKQEDTFLSLAGSAELDLCVMGDGGSNHLEKRVGCNMGLIGAIRHCNAAILLSFQSCHVLRMARFGWMAQKLKRGVTYQTEAEDMNKRTGIRLWVGLCEI